jgi:vitamin B12 transporter
MDRKTWWGRALRAIAAALWLGLSGTRETAGASEASATDGRDGGVVRTEPVTVTATRVEQPAAQVGSSVTVIEGEELRQQGIGSVGEALRRVPGLTVATNGARGKQTSIFLRGADSGQTLVLVDGVRINDPVGGAVDLGFLRTDNIERIEVVRGPQSTLYGSDAVGGVVNIITRRGRGPAAAELEAAAGNFDTYQVGAGLRGGGRRVGGTAGASRFSTDNERENDEFDADTLSGRLDADFGDRLSTAVTARWVDAEVGVPGSAFFPPTSGRQENDLLTVGLSANLRATSVWTQRLSAGLTDREQRFRSPGSSSDSDARTRAVEWVHGIAPTDALSLLGGAEYRVEDGEFANSQGTDIDATLYTRALFAQAQVTPVRDRLFLQVGARLDDSTRIDEEVSPRVAAALLVPETGTRLHGSWGKGIKSPSLLDLFFPPVDFGFGPVFGGDPNLKPERSTGWDVGVGQRLLGRRIEADVTFFRNDFEDLIAPAQTFPFNFANVSKAHSYGVETSVAAYPADWLDLGATYAYTEARDDVDRTQLLNRPRNQGSASATARPTGAASVTLSGIYVGKRRNFLATDAGYNGGYFRLDASATYRLPIGRRIGAELFGRVENLLDRDYADVAGFPALGTSLLAGIRGTF